MMKQIFLFILLLVDFSSFLQAENIAGLEKRKVEYAVFKGNPKECRKFIDKADEIEFLEKPYPHNLGSKQEHEREFSKYKSHEIFKKCPNAFKPIQAFLDFKSPYGNWGDKYRVYENIDIDNDGKRDIVVMYGQSFQRTWAESYWKVESDTCNVETIYENYSPNIIAYFDNTYYIMHYYPKLDHELKNPYVYLYDLHIKKMRKICGISTKEFMKNKCTLELFMNNSNCKLYLKTNTTTTKGEKK